MSFHVPYRLRHLKRDPGLYTNRLVDVAIAGALSIYLLLILIAAYAVLSSLTG